MAQSILDVVVIAGGTIVFVTLLVLYRRRVFAELETAEEAIRQTSLSLAGFEERVSRAAEKHSTSSRRSKRRSRRRRRRRREDGSKHENRQN
jgi:hypothetical protein